MNTLDTLLPLGTKLYTLGIREKASMRNNKAYFTYAIYPRELTIAEIRVGRATPDAKLDSLSYGPLFGKESDISYIAVTAGSVTRVDAAYSPKENYLVCNHKIAGTVRKAFADRDMLKEYAEELKIAIKNNYKSIDAIDVDQSV